MHYIWQNKPVSFLKISFKGKRLIIVIVLVILYYFETTLFSFSLIFEKFQIMSVTLFWCLYCQIRIYFTPFSSVYCWAWTIRCLVNLLTCNCSENYLKRRPTGPKQGVRFRRCPLQKGVYFRKGFQEMWLKWRKIQKRSRLLKQRHSTYR